MFKFIEEENVNKINVKARNPHQKVEDDNERAKRLSNVGLENEDFFKKDDEEDLELLYEFDSFYKTTKSLLVLFQIMGLVPIERSGVGRTTFR